MKYWDQFSLMKKSLGGCNMSICKLPTRIYELTSSYPSGTVLCAASLRGMPLSILKAFERDDVVSILPVIILKGIEFDGPTETDYITQWRIMSKHVCDKYDNKKVLHPPLIYSNIDLWQAFNVTYANTIRDLYGDSNICVTCKAYFSIIQIHLATKFGMRLLMSEKLNKDKSKFKLDLIKVDSLSYSDERLLDHFKIERMTLIDHTTPVAVIKSLIPDGWFYLDDATCLFEGSWKSMLSMKTKFDVSDKIVREFIYPLSRILIECLNVNPRMEKVAINGTIRRFTEGLVG